MSGKIKVIDKANFDEEVLKSDVPVLVDFYATWCGPCRSMEPVLDEVAKEKAEKAIFCKIDVDENEEITNRFGIRSVPTILVFFKGKIIERIVGVTAKKAILEKLDSIE